MVDGMLTRLGRAVWSGSSRMLRRPSFRPLVAAVTAAHAWLYRLSGGRAQAPAYPTLLLTVVGRRSGRQRTVPLVYVMDSADYIVAAAYSGSDRHPAWWLNLRSSSVGVVQVGRRKTAVQAVEIASPHRDDWWVRLAAMYPPFEDYQHRTARQIPVVRLTPRSALPTEPNAPPTHGSASTQPGGR